MISKTKYKAMLPELKELDINIWDLLPNKLDGFFDVLENYIKQQGFSINSSFNYSSLSFNLSDEEFEIFKTVNIALLEQLVKNKQIKLNSL